jgi:hypothetical protein
MLVHVRFVGVAVKVTGESADAGGLSQVGMITAKNPPI